MTPAGLPTAYRLEALIDGSWVDLTSYVWAQPGLTIARGRQDAQSQVQPGRLTVGLVHSGELTPDDPTSPYYPHLTDGLQLRVLYGTDVRYTGYLGEAPYSWETPTALACSWSARDVSERLSVRSGTLRPFIVEDALLDSPVSLLPLTESGDAVVSAGNLGSVPGSGVVHQVGAGGAIAWGQGTGPGADGASALSLTPSAGQGWYLQVPTRLSGCSGITIEAMICATSGAAMTLVDLANPAIGDPWAGYGLTLSITPAGRLEWRSDVSLVVTSTASVADGHTHHVAAVYQHTGAAHTTTLYVDGSAVATGSVVTSYVNIYARYLFVGGSTKLPLYSGSISYVGVSPSALSAARLASHWHAGVDGYGGERSDQRISRLATYGGLSGLLPEYRTGVWVLGDAALSVLGSTTVLADSDLSLETGSARIWGQSTGGSSAWAAIQDVADTEGGLVLVDRAGQVRLQSRSHRYNVPAAAVLDATTPAVAASLQPTRDAWGVVNDVTSTTQDGASYRVTDAASIAQRGVYDDQLRLLTRDSADAYSAAAWAVSRLASPRTRYPQVTVQLHGLPEDQVAELLALEVGDRIDLVQLPGGRSAVAWVEGIAESVSASGWTLTLTTSAQDEQVWRLDDPALSVLDSTTRLAW